MLRRKADELLEYLDAGGNLSRSAVRSFAEEVARAIDEKPERGYRLWVNDERTILVRLWNGGTLEVATREEPAAPWGAPTICLEETPS